MRRRNLMMFATAGATMLACPSILRAETRTSTLRFVPTPDLTAMDPMVVGNRATHTHAFLVFDTLYGVDAQSVVRPQMAQGHVVEQGGLDWRIRLRDGLMFHDGSPVRARDAVASIRRWATRDGFGQALVAAIEEISAPDDHTIRIRLKRPFPQLPLALAGSTRTVPCIMPERLASADPFRPVAEMVGSGPYRFAPGEFDPGHRAAYVRFGAYLPRVGEPPSHTAGGKVAHFERIEWHSISDPTTATAALRKGEVDWLEWPQVDQLPLLRQAPGIRLAVTEPTGSIGIMRLNHRHPPFDNPAVRRAVLGAVDQTQFMMAVAGEDQTSWSAPVGLFGPGHPLETKTGLAAMSSRPDGTVAAQALRAAGYRGEPVTVLVVAGNSVIPLLSQVGAAQLRQAGFNVIEQTMDIGTQLRRLQNAQPPSEGGWNVHFGIFDGVVNLSPATNDFLRGDGRSGAPGWMVSPRLEELRLAFLTAETLEEQRRIAADVQGQMVQDVPYVPLGSWTHATALRDDLTDITPGFPLFYGVRRG